MDEKQVKSNGSGGWLKALAVLALLSGGIPEAYTGSAAMAGFVFVLLATLSDSVFYCLYLLATGALVWLAFASGEPIFAWYAALYVVLGIVLVAANERRRGGHGHFLMGTWWLGEALLLGLDIRHAYASGGASGFFTDLFLVISGMMALKGFAGGVRQWLRDRTEAKRYVPTEVVAEEPLDKAA